MTPGDQAEKEISSIHGWVEVLDAKVDRIIQDGCAHRGNDLDKITRMEQAVEGTRKEAGRIKETVTTLAISLEQHKSQVILGQAASTERVFNLKIWILANILILVVAVVGFVFKEFVIPATMNQTSMRQVEMGTVTIPQEQYKEIIDALIRAKEVDRPPGPQGHIPR